ncbi:MAG: AraC family transcriptional regulator [Balneola sp.]
MSSTVLHIKNMVCGRCIKVVQEEIARLGYPVKHIELGKVEFEEGLDVDISKVEAVLEKEGFELIDDESTRIINRVKTLIIKLIHEDGGKQNQNLSTFLEKELNKSYSSLSSLFSTVEGRTIEKYAIQQRIERVKELLIYGEKTISEIAWELGYSSAQYLSNQFKSETGLSPSQFRKMLANSRKSLDEV